MLFLHMCSPISNTRWIMYCLDMDLWNVYQSLLEPISKKPKVNFNATKQEHTQKIIDMIFISNNQTPVVLKPGKKSFDFPATHVTPELSTIMGARFFSKHLIY